MPWLRFLVAATIVCLAAEPACAGDGRAGGKLLLTDGITTVEGSAGGGIATWALVAGNETDRGLGGTAHATIVAVPDFTLRAFGIALGLRNRVELSYTRQSFDTRRTGAALGLGRGFRFGQDVYGAKLRILGDAIWDQDRALPQLAIGVQHKVAGKAAVVRAVGGSAGSGTDLYVAATKLFLAQGILADATVRLTAANQFGLLGHGGDRRRGRRAQIEGSLAKMLARNVVIGGEYRTKPDNLGFAKENDTFDAFAAWAVHRNLTLTAAYVDLGDVATIRGQRGVFLQLQGAF